MALSIKDPETEQLARALAQLTGENITTATKRAIEERLRRLGGQTRKDALLQDMAEIRRIGSSTINRSIFAASASLSAIATIADVSITISVAIRARHIRESPQACGHQPLAFRSSVA